ncbi:hypothetical protein [Gilvibacter sp.]|uniref:hypothetical protein n=1 Tax=Gilvibacter sp. TaxID=2729997 RepID=UPI0025BD79A9|nr:hypothetical protein [Gilvibacter sp.]NQX78248.1 hypothetical protein [Gilvibacter sp.]
MKRFTSRLLLLLSLVITAISCDDGDIIVTTFDFDDIALTNCGEVGDYVFFKVNNTNLESISLVLGTSDEIYLSTAERTYALNGTSNFVNYRTYTGEVDASFFCSNVTPSEPQIVDDFAGNSGDAVLDVIAVEDDNDGIALDNELDELNEDGDDDPFTNPLDTDGDGLPDYIDFDDDGDNIPTENELDNENADGDDNPFTNPRDTDNDGIPDYLDPDDDGDGILTRNEDTNSNENPADDVTDPSVGPDYLNPAVANETVVESYRQHSFTLNTSVTVTLLDLVLSNGTEELIRESLFLGTIDDAFNATFTVTPEFTND